MSGPFASLRQRLDYKPAKHHTRPILTGAIVIGVIVLALVSAALRHVPFIGKSGREVKIELRAANQVSNRTVVRVGGIDVGRVDKVEPSDTPDRTSLVTIRLNDDDVVLHKDAAAHVRWRTLLGGLMYIDLVPGSDSAPKMADDEIIPASRTTTQTELDQFLQPYDGNTDEAQRGVLKGLRNTFSNPSGVGRTLETLPALQSVADGLKPLRGRDADDLRGLVHATARTVSGLADAPALQGLVTGGNQTLATTTARRRELGELIDLSPPSLDSTFTTMKRLRTTLDHLDPLAVALRPGARALAPASRAATPAFVQTEAVLREARPLLRSAEPSFAALRRAGNTGVPLMNGLKPTLSRLQDELLPYLREQDSETRLRNFEAIGPFWSALAMAASEFDSSGHRIRFTVPPSTNSYVSQAISAAQRHGRRR